LIAKNTAVLALESTVRLWDFAAAWLIIKEAGGIIESLEGDQPFPTHPGSDYQDKPFPIIAAVSPEVMNRAKENITRK
jgi:myo-inositol-1(or 4)-monophosphatase